MKKFMISIIMILSLLLIVGCAITDEPTPGDDPQPGQNNGVENGTDENGTDENGTDENGTDENGTDENGTDENGTDENGTDENGTDENGTDENDSNDEQGLTVTDLFPMERDVHMRYRGEGNEYASYETYVEFLSEDVIQIRSINPGTTVAEVYTIENGSVIKVYTAGEIYHRYDYTEQRETEEIMIMEPIKEGTTWTLDNGSERSITAVDKEIVVPAGTYRAVEVTTAGSDSTVRHYYVEGIGLVKNEFVAAGSEDYPITSELESRERDLPLEQSIRIFYPDFLNDRLVFIGTEIQLNTNEDIFKEFESVLKEVPEDSELTPLLTENTRIVSIHLNEAERVLTVDLSENFVDELNAGTTLEAMILQGLTNTFGEYFNVRYVAILLDGNLYRSGHFELAQWEYFTVVTEDIEEY